METYTSSEYVKVVTDEVVSGGTKITYVGYASLEGPKAYTSTSDLSEPIRKIRKIVDDGTLTETFYAEGKTAFAFVWNDRASLTYI